jgi:ABC-2 type transport system permease protein
VTLAVDLRGSRDILVNLTLREIRGKYKRTVLGQLWSLLNPVAQLATYALVFGLILTGNKPAPGDPSGLDVFVVWLATGLIPWLFFANVVTSGMGAIIGNANLIQKVYFPRSSLVISAALALLFTFFIEMTVVVVLVLIFGGTPLLYLPATIFFMLMLFAFGLGISFVLATANVYFRDTQHFVGILMQIWFYATPILYPMTLVAAHYPSLVVWVRANPIARFMEIFRDTLYNGRWPTLTDSVFVTVVSLVVLVVGYAVFMKFEGRLAEEL